MLSSLFDEAGADNVNGAYRHRSDAAAGEADRRGQDVLDDFLAAEGGKPVEVYTVYAAAAAQVLLDAISRSDGTR